MADQENDHVDVEYVLWDSGGDFAFTITTVPNDCCVTIQYHQCSSDNADSVLISKPTAELAIGGAKHARQVGELLIKAAKHLEEKESPSDD